MNPFLRFGSIPEGTFSKLLNLCLVPVKLSKQMQEEAKKHLEIWKMIRSTDLTTNPMAWYPCRQLPLLLCTTQSSKMDGLELGASTRCIMFFHGVVPSRLSYQIRSIASKCFMRKKNWLKFLYQTFHPQLPLQVHPKKGKKTTVGLKTSRSPPRCWPLTSEIRLSWLVDVGCYGDMDKKSWIFGYTDILSK